MSIPPMKLECPPFDLGLQKLLSPDTTPKDLPCNKLILVTLLTDTWQSLFLLSGAGCRTTRTTRPNGNKYILFFRLFENPWFFLSFGFVHWNRAAEINPDGLSAMFFRAPQVSRDHVEKLVLRVTRWETLSKEHHGTKLFRLLWRICLLWTMSALGQHVWGRSKAEF